MTFLITSNAKPILGLTGLLLSTSQIKASTYQNYGGKGKGKLLSATILIQFTLRRNCYLRTKKSLLVPITSLSPFKKDQDDGGGQR